MLLTLKVTAGPFKGRIFTFSGHDTFLVGRSQRAHFQLAAKDKRFSRIHFLVEVNPPHCRLLDMGSKNGTFVNDQRVTQADLQPGDKIRAGRTVLRVFIEEREADTLVGPEPVLPALAQPLPAPKPSRQPDRPSQGCRVCAAPAVPDGLPLCPACRAMADSHPQPIAGYRIVRELGHGGMGVAYLALGADGTPVALKTIKPAVTPREADLIRFRREASILYELDHPNIVSFRDLGECNGLLYFAMDYVRGTDASNLLKQHGPLPIDRAVGLVCQMLQALDYAHAKGFVHRDIKPSNLLVKEEGEHEIALLADFGLARVYHSSRLSGLTMVGDKGGTPQFMPPEQIADFRNVKPPADQYSAAATLYNLLTRRYLFDFPPKFEEQLAMILEKEPVPIQSRRPDIPPFLAAIIHRGLAKEPADRFADVRTMRRELLRV